MSTDISLKILNEEYEDNRKKLIEYYSNEYNLLEDLEAFLIEANLPRQLAKAYRKAQLETNRTVLHHIKNQNSDHDIYYNQVHPDLTYVNLNRRGSPIDFSQASYKQVSKQEALNDLHITLKIDGEDWTFDEHNMPEDPSSIKIKCSNPEDAGNKIKNYRFVWKDGSLNEFEYRPEKGQFFAIYKSVIPWEKWEKFGYDLDTLITMNSKAQNADSLRADFLGTNTIKSVFWVIALADYIFITDEYEHSIPGREQHQAQLKNSSFLEPAGSFGFSNAVIKGLPYLSAPTLINIIILKKVFNYIKDEVIKFLNKYGITEEQFSEYMKDSSNSTLGNWNKLFNIENLDLDNITSIKDSEKIFDIGSYVNINGLLYDLKQYLLNKFAWPADSPNYSKFEQQYSILEDNLKKVYQDAGKLINVEDINLLIDKLINLLAKTERERKILKRRYHITRVPYFDYKGSSKNIVNGQPVERTPYTPFTYIRNNNNTKFAFDNIDTGNHKPFMSKLNNNNTDLNSNDLEPLGYGRYDNTNVNWTHRFREIRATKNKAKQELLAWDYKLKQLKANRQEFENEDAYTSRLEKYQTNYNEAAQHYIDICKQLKRINDKIVYANEGQFIKIKNRMKDYFATVELFYSRIKQVSDKLSDMNNWTIDKIQDVFGGNVAKLIEQIEKKLQAANEVYNDFQDAIAEDKAKIDELQKQLAEMVNKLNKEQADSDKQLELINNLQAEKDKLNDNLQGEDFAVDQFYKERINLNNLGKQLESQLVNYRNANYAKVNQPKDSDEIIYRGEPKFKIKKKNFKPEADEQINSALTSLQQIAKNLQLSEKEKEETEKMSVNDEPEDIFDDEKEEN